MLRPFHLAFPVRDLEETRRFYVDVLGCGVGREAESWIDFDLFGHQIVAHLDLGRATRAATGGVDVVNPVDGHGVPVPHFGIVLEHDEWQRLAERIAKAGVRFEIEPYLRFEGQAGEQGTFFCLDPSGNALEFKTFKDLGQLFARD